MTQTIDMDSDDCRCPAHPAGPPLDPALKGQSDRYFTSVRAEAYRAVRAKEKDVLAVPWGPRVDVTFDPKGALGVVGGRVRVMARTGGTEIEVASATITSATDPVTMSVATGCDEYVVKAALGTDPGANARRIESYVYARVYTGR